MSCGSKICRGGFRTACLPKGASLSPEQRGASVELARLRAEHFDAGTRDMLMPGLSGFEVLQAIRADPQLERLPIVAVSVLAGHSALAGEWSVAKPIDADELVDALRAAVLARRTRVLVVSERPSEPLLTEARDELGLEHAWASDAEQAAGLCDTERFEAALVDAHLSNPEAALAALALRGRRLDQAVIVYSDREGTPGGAHFGAAPVAGEDAAGAVFDLLGGYSLQPSEPGMEDR